MRTFYHPAILAALPLAGIMLSVGGCQSGAKTADQVCSATETYDALTGLMASTLGQAISDQAGEGDDKSSLTSASSVAKLSQHIKFSLPTVADVNKDTKKISCNAMLTITAPQTAMLSVPSVDLPVNEQGKDHITYRVSYSVQPTADDHQNLYVLDHGEELALAAFKATLASEKLLGTALQEPAKTDDTGNSAEPAADAQPDTSNDDSPVTATLHACDGNPDSFYCTHGTPASPALVNGAASGMKYSVARALLIKGGFSPVPRSDDDACHYSGSCSYTEAEACTAAGVAFCKYDFRKGGLNVVVIGAGEDDDQTVDTITMLNDQPPADSQ